MIETQWTGRDLKNNLKQGGMADNQLVQHYIDIFMISNSCKGFVNGGKIFICNLSVSTMTEFEKENWICTEQRVKQFKSLMENFKPDMAKLVSFSKFSKHLFRRGLYNKFRELTINEINFSVNGLTIMYSLQIKIPVVYSSHFIVYSLNMYISGGRLDIIDSRKYTKDYLFKTRAEYHSNIGPIMVRTLLSY